MKWNPINTAPPLKYKTIKSGKGIIKVLVPQKLLVFLNGEYYYTWQLENGRWNGFTKEQTPTHWLELDPPSEKGDS